MAANKPIAEYTKDPSALLDYILDWAGSFPSGDSLSSSVVTADAGITVESQTVSGLKHTVWLSGGTVGSSYLVVCEVTSAGGRRDQRTLRITVADR
jgi:hypothetical protein